MQLDELIAAAVEDPSREAEVFARLLESTLYVHAPRIPTGPRLSVVQFKTPQGVMATPVFTDRKKAEFAGGHNVRIIPIPGRTLLQAMPGATIVINPNDAWCMLYPEEIAALLEGRRLSPPPETVTLPPSMTLRRPVKQDVDLLAQITSALSTCEDVASAWLTEAAKDQDGPAEGYVLVVHAESIHHQRIANALSLAFANPEKCLQTTFDVTFVDSEAALKWEEQGRDCLVFRREWRDELADEAKGHA